MSFIPGLILGILIAVFKDEILGEIRNFGSWARRIFYYHRLRLRILNKNDVNKKILSYYYKENYLTLKQYHQLYQLHRRMRKLRLITRSSCESMESRESAHMM